MVIPLPGYSQKDSYFRPFHQGSNDSYYKLYACTQALERHFKKEPLSGSPPGADFEIFKVPDNSPKDRNDLTIIKTHLGTLIPTLYGFSLGLGQYTLLNLDYPISFKPDVLIVGRTERIFLLDDGDHFALKMKLNPKNPAVLPLDFLWAGERCEELFYSPEHGWTDKEFLSFNCRKPIMRTYVSKKPYDHILAYLNLLMEGLIKIKSKSPHKFIERDKIPNTIEVCSPSYAYISEKSEGIWQPSNILFQSLMRTKSSFEKVKCFFQYEEALEEGKDCLRHGVGKYFNLPSWTQNLNFSAGSIKSFLPPYGFSEEESVATDL